MFHFVKEKSLSTYLINLESKNIWVYGFNYDPSLPLKMAFIQVYTIIILLSDSVLRSFSDSLFVTCLSKDAFHRSNLTYFIDSHLYLWFFLSAVVFCFLFSFFLETGDDNYLPNISNKKQLFINRFYDCVK